MAWAFYPNPKLSTPAKPYISNQEWLSAINSERQKVGVAPLQLDARLNTSAQRKAAEMASEGLDSTPHANKQGIAGYTYAEKADPNCTYVSENIIWDYKSVPDAVNWWMNSSTHRQAILDFKYTTTGFGSAGIFTVEHFCAL